MASKTIETRAIISAQDKTGSTFAQVAQKLAQMQRSADGASRRLTAVQTKAVQQAEGRAAGLVAGGKALVGAYAAYSVGSTIKQSVEDWADLELAVTRLGNTGEVTTDKVAETIQTFRKLGPSMGASAKDVATAAEVYVAAGIDFDKAVQGTPAALKAAKASGAELTDIVGAGVASMNNLGITADKLDNAFDIMAKGGKLGSFELKNMAKELPSVASRAKALGIKGEGGLAKIVAMLETTRKTAATGEEAANNLLNFFDKIVSQDTSKSFKKMGVDLEKELKHGATKGKDYVDTTLELVEKLTKGDAFKIAKLFPDRQAREGIMALLRFKNEYQDMYRVLKTQSIGTNARDFNATMDTARMKIDRMKASWNTLMTNLGERVGVPMFQPLFDRLNELFDRVKEAERKQASGDFSERDGQRKFNRLMNAAVGGGLAGSDQSVFDASVERAARDKRARDLEDELVEKQARLRKRADELRGSVASTPFAGVRVRDSIELKKVNDGLDDIGPKVENLQRLREELSRLIVEGAPLARELNRIGGLGINQVPSMGAPLPVLGRGAFPMSVGGPTGWNTKGRSPWGQVDPLVQHGVRPGELILGSQEWKVSLDPASKAEVTVNVKVDASSQLINAFTESKRVTSAGNISAGIGTVGTTGVGAQGD